MKRNLYKLLSGAKPALFALALLIGSGVAYSQASYTLNYTAGAQTLNLQAGTYSIECWGADGGTNSSNTALPGKGGYSSGSFSLSAAETLTIYVGGKGNAGAQPLGGFNSGNSTTKTNLTTATGGGGATDVRVLIDDLYHRIIVAGGGGGQGTSTGTGGHGGGLAGQDGQGTTNAGQGGTQIAPGIYPGGGDSKPATFGEGGDGPSGTTGGQGGGGWYGGSFGTRTNGGGAGGSGYVLTPTSYTPPGYFSAHANYYFTNAVTLRADESGFVPNPDASGNGMAIIRALCDVNVMASSNPICEGASITLSTNAGSNIQWSTGPTTPSISVSPQVTTTYTVSGVSSGTSACSSTLAITVSVNPNPQLSTAIIPTVICAGQSATVLAGGATTYSWSGSQQSSSVTLSPMITTSYTLTGFSPFGCSSTHTFAVQVSDLPLSSSGNTVICRGQGASLSVSGGKSYLWNNAAPFPTILVHPTVTTTYSVNALDMNDCPTSTMITVTVNDLPQLSASAVNSVVCRGETIELAASGADSFTWTSLGTGSTQTVLAKHDVPQHFTVTGMGSNGCTSFTTVTVEVLACLGVPEHRELLYSIYPNPAHGSFTISGKSGTRYLSIIDAAGRKVYEEQSEGATSVVRIPDIAAGIYHVFVIQDNARWVGKLVLE